MTPRFMGFMKPMATDSPPSGEGWIHEIKHDGYRTQICVGEGMARAYSKSGHDWTSKYRLLTEAAADLACRAAVLDGEVVSMDKDGRSDFAALPEAIRHGSGRLVFIAFDLLHLDGHDLRRVPLLQRKEALKQLVGTGGGRLQYNDHWGGDGREFFRACDAFGLEGIVSKRTLAAYKAGATRQWLKTKCYRVDDFDVIGIGRTRKGEHVAYLAFPGSGSYAGAAFVTLRRADRDRFWNAVDRLKTDRPVAPKEPASVRLLPGLKAKVRHLRGEDRLRHASIVGIDDSSV